MKRKKEKPNIMENTTKYEDIPVTLAVGIEMKFNFEVGQNEEFGQFARMTTDGHELIVDEDLAFLGGNMPVEWRGPAIAKLLLIIHAHRRRDGKLF